MLRRHGALSLALVWLATLACPPVAAAQPSILRVGLPEVPGTLDPATAIGGPTALISVQVFDTLVRYRDNSSEVEASLASRWAVSREGLSWTFRLREGVRLHDGTSLTAQQVAASLERVLFPNPAAPRPNAAGPRLLRGAPGVVKQVRAPDGRTLQIDLLLPYAPLLTVLAHPALSIAVPSRRPDGSTRLIGTGPFIPVEMTPGHIVLDPHRAHWSGSPRIGRIEFIGDPEPVRLASDLDKRGLDVVIPPSAPARVPGARSVPGWDIGYLALQTEKEPFRRKKARQAVAAGLEPRLISGAVGMEAIPLQSFLPAGVGGRREGSPIMLGSAESARRLLAEAGLQSRLSFTLLVGASPGSLPDPARVAQAIRTSLAPAGITVAFQSEAKDTAVAVAQDGEHEAVLMEAQVNGGDPHLLLYPLSSSEATTKGRNAWNVSFYRNSHLDDLLIRGSQLSFPPERMRVYSRAQAFLAEELPWIPIYVRLHWVVARPEVKNLRLHPSGGHRLDRVSLEAGGESPASQ